MPRIPSIDRTNEAVPPHPSLASVNVYPACVLVRSARAYRDPVKGQLSHRKMQATTTKCHCHQLSDGSTLKEEVNEVLGRVSVHCYIHPLSQPSNVALTLPKQLRTPPVSTPACRATPLQAETGTHRVELRKGSVSRRETAARHSL